MAVCEGNGASIHYQDNGGVGAPVLFVHGGLHELMAAERFWARPGVASAVAAAGHRVLLPDRRWSGGATSACLAVHTWSLEAADLAAVLRHAGAWPAQVVAGSNGCTAALRLALEHPELVAGLVLCWPVAGHAPSRGWLAAAFERSAAHLDSHGTRAYLEELLQHGMPRPGQERPGSAFGAALLRDQRARDSLAQLDGRQAARLVRASGRALLDGETVRGAADAELRSLRAGGPVVSVLAPANDDPEHTRASADRLAVLTGAVTAAAGFPETPRPEFGAAREEFIAELLSLLGRTAR